ncbi:hypothetical protein [Rhodonellum sp.]|uniref:hypothetical protein n=1 Tax=Rhodonellum sp. TaxID=2231180 RepID=UPI002717B795|nr:hypothetical protein [Rhodonellum sp.]MDO9553309.1 hypothetical protein [Rhodonellum sp.]
MQNQSLAIGPTPTGTFPELMLVFELAGSVEDFFIAVNKVPDLYFLKEYETEFPADDFFAAESDKPVPGRIFVSLANQKALKDLQRLWNIYIQPDEKQYFEKGLAKFKQFFGQLRDVRPYSILDRIRDTGLETYILELKQQGEEWVKFEIEFAYPESSPKREKGLKEVRRLLEAHKGQVLEDSIVDLRAIHYLACIAEAPISAFDDLTENTDIKFLKASQVLYFRPVGQVILPERKIDGELEKYPESDEGEETFGNPVIALLDGMPLSHHPALEGKLMIDDPDNYEATYEIGSRKHGTSMASLILNGDLSDNKNKLVRPIYVRPVMKANKMGSEYFPDDILPIDLFHRAVKRMLVGEGGEAPTAPEVKIINISIGDIFRPYLLEVSSWAKLLDWLSWEYYSQCRKFNR